MRPRACAAGVVPVIVYREALPSPQYLVPDQLLNGLHDVAAIDAIWRAGRQWAEQSSAQACGVKIVELIYSV